MVICWQRQKPDFWFAGVEFYELHRAWFRKQKTLPATAERLSAAFEKSETWGHKVYPAWPSRLHTLRRFDDLRWQDIRRAALLRRVERSRFYTAGTVACGTASPMEASYCLLPPCRCNSMVEAVTCRMAVRIRPPELLCIHRPLVSVVALFRFGQGLLFSIFLLNLGNQRERKDCPPFPLFQVSICRCTSMAESTT